MFEKIKNGVNLLQNMGWRYTQFRMRYEFMRRTGLLKKRFPVSPNYLQYISRNEWLAGNQNFFFESRESLSFLKQPLPIIEETFLKIKQGKFVYFNSTEFDLGKNYDWVTNPDTGFTYDVNKHWTEIADFSKEAGDIKYVWEKSRFSYLYDIIRYDYHFQKDCAEFVFSEIICWIKANPINRGPNYRCSQEMSLRVLNWTFALHYYRNSTFLTDAIFNQIQFAIYWQMDHVYRNINFSRIAVRNNHAITETLTLYLVGLLYPQFPGADKWKEEGKTWFEQEIAYQIYPDGTFLQFSMNYHRVVVQLLTWAIVLSEKNQESFAPLVYERAKRSVEFLRTCMIDENGRLPNYGANDGALFFRLNNAEYRDYSPTLNALAKAINTDLLFPPTEDEQWYGISERSASKWSPSLGIHAFEDGGYYLFRESETLTFIRCGNHKDRPSQADNLHLDVWYKGENVLLDGGSYQYNTDKKTMSYFMGTASHNTVMLDDYDQMKKGGRFIWYHWSQKKEAFIEVIPDTFHFKGSVYAFNYISKGILHEREIFKLKGKPRWSIKDKIINKPEGLLMKQLWHLPLKNSVNWSNHSNEDQIEKRISKGWMSGLYGKKEPCEMIIFQTKGNELITEIDIEPTGF